MEYIKNFAFTLGYLDLQHDFILVYMKNSVLLT
jgi:hypothetical protein